MFDQRGELPLLPFGNPIGFVPALRGGVYIEKEDSPANFYIRTISRTIYFRKELSKMTSTPVEPRGHRVAEYEEWVKEQRIPTRGVFRQRF